MNIQDRERLGRLGAILERGYRLTELYARYLSHFPELITEEMISALTADGDMTEGDAITAILTEAFGLDYDKPEDRRLIRDYLIPSVRIMDEERYVNNPYYRNIKLDNVKEGSWEIRLESYKPYRAVIANDMEIYGDLREIPPLGFFKKEFFFPAVLEDGNEWMTLTPVDLNTSDEAIEAAHGRVVTFGLGLGYYAYMVSQKDEVESITVVEKSHEVISLFKKHILPQFENAHKVRIIESDAFEYAEKIMPKEKFDVAFVDTWRDASDGAPMYERMKELEHLSRVTRFLYWIENFLVSRLRSIVYEKILYSIESNSEGQPKSYAEAENWLRNPLECKL